MKELCAAMAKASGEISHAKLNKSNPHFKSKYASLDSVIDAIKPALSKNGLWFTQTFHNIDGYAAVETTIIHSSGETMSCGTICIPLEKKTPQGYGSALTYARRMSLSTSFGIFADEDDDANAAEDEVAKAAAEKEKPKPVKKLKSGEIGVLAMETISFLGMNADASLAAMIAFITALQEKYPNQAVLDVVVGLRADRDKFFRWYNGFMESGKSVAVDQKSA